jgi:hypothetical protein
MRATVIGAGKQRWAKKAPPIPAISHARQYHPARNITMVPDEPPQRESDIVLARMEGLSTVTFRNGTKYHALLRAAS